MQMIEETSGRGFQLVKHDGYPADATKGIHRLVSQSSSIGNYDDSWDRPGTSALWIDEHFHLNREEVSKLMDYLNHWLETGKLFDAHPATR